MACACPLFLADTLVCMCARGVFHRVAGVHCCSGNLPLCWCGVCLLTAWRFESYSEAWTGRLRFQHVAPARSDMGTVFRDGRDSTGAHADRLTLLGVRPIIASVSLGAARLFRMRRAVAADEGSGDANERLSPACSRGRAGVGSAPGTAGRAGLSSNGSCSKGGGSGPAVKRRKLSPPAVDITLEHNSLLIMMPPAQEAFKHEVGRSRTSVHLKLPTPHGWTCPPNGSYSKHCCFSGPLCAQMRRRCGAEALAADWTGPMIGGCSVL